MKPQLWVNWYNAALTHTGPEFKPPYHINPARWHSCIPSIGEVEEGKSSLLQLYVEISVVWAL